MKITPARSDATQAKTPQAPRARSIIALPPFSPPRPRVEAQNRFFATQWGPTPWNSAAHPAGYLECGPTSLLVVASSLGLVEPPTAATAEADISVMRDLTRGKATPQSGPTWQPLLIHGLKSIGAKAQPVPMTLAAVDTCLAAGGRMVIAGRPNAWGPLLDQKGQYLHHYGNKAADQFGHWVSVLGKTADGLYIVADPLSRAGCIAVDGSALQRFWKDGASLSAAVAVYPQG
jgi:hypothetical protein